VRSAVLSVTHYEASGGTEYFITYDDPSTDALLGFLRLRLPGRSLRPEITPASAIIRELHVYGIATGLGETGDVQHRGLGRKLVEVAERIAREGGKDKMLVISGVGVKQYYARLGYAHDGPYMSKLLS
jgi:elongator complex protein 3